MARNPDASLPYQSKKDAGRSSLQMYDQHLQGDGIESCDGAANGRFEVTKIPGSCLVSCEMASASDSPRLMI